MIDDGMSDYVIDSSEEDSEDEKGSHHEFGGERLVTIEDLEELKLQTMEVLDPNWKSERNKHLIGKMLELEEPSITSQVSARCY
jgi:hypothetical protein